MAMSLASSSRWIQLLILGVCEDLERVRFFIGEIIGFPKTGCDMSKFYGSISEGTHHFQLETSTN